MKPDNFYDRDDIKRIDKMDHAGDMLTLYDKLIFFTMNRDGLLAYKMGDGYEEYPIEDIAEDFNYPVELVKETLDVFSKFHTIFPPLYYKQSSFHQDLLHYYPL